MIDTPQLAAGIFINIYKRHAMQLCAHSNILKKLSFFIIYQKFFARACGGCWFSPAWHQVQTESSGVLFEQNSIALTNMELACNRKKRGDR